MLGERSGRTVNVLHALTLDLEQEGLLNAEEIHRHVEKVLEELGDVPVALVIPQSSTISQLMDMGKKWPYNVKKAIQEETRNLSGLSDKSILYDFVQMRPFARFRAPFWVTIARENEVEDHLDLLSASGRRIEAITTPANALINAFRALCPGSQEGLLVDVGESSTTVALVEGGQGIFATNIALGGEHFTEAISQDEGCTFEEAKDLKQQKDFFKGDASSPALVSVLDRWCREIDDVVLEWSREQGVPMDRYRFFPCWLSGGCSRQPGLSEYLEREWRTEIRRWPGFSAHAADVDVSDFVISYGAALSAFGKGEYSVSLLPNVLRRARVMERQVRNLYAFGAVALLTLLVVMGNAIAGMVDGIREKRREVEHYERVEAVAAQIDGVREEWRRTYRQVLPLFYYKKAARDLMETLAFLGRISEENRFWFVLLSDREHYFEGAAAGGAARPGQGQQALVEDMVGIQRSFIVEVCVPAEDEEEALMLLGDVVAELRDAPFLWSVDRLPAGQRRLLVPDEATIQEHTYALILELEPFSHGIAESPSLEWTGTPHFITRP